MNKGYRDLRVWQDAKSIAVDTYLLIRHSPALDKDWGLKDQMQRSAVSIPSNIAEGDARKSNKDSIRFLYIALGSVAELSTQLEIARAVGYIEESPCEKMTVRLVVRSRSLGALIKGRQST